jgi:hypothetical protein
MEENMKVSFVAKWFKKMTLPLLAVLMLVGLLGFAPASPVYAQTGPDPTTTPRQKLVERREDFLAKSFQREKDALAKQQENLDKTAQAVTKAQDLINKAKGEGKDVAALESALALFNTQIANAKSLHETAASVLNTHAGFDASGTVTDAQAARQTVMDARQSIRDAHRVLAQSVRDLHQAVRAWRKGHKPDAGAAAPESTPSPTTNS